MELTEISRRWQTRLSLVYKRIVYKMVRLIISHLLDPQTFTFSIYSCMFLCVWQSGRNFCEIILVTEDKFIGPGGYFVSIRLLRTCIICRICCHSFFPPKEPSPAILLRFLLFHWSAVGWQKKKKLVLEGCQDKVPHAFHIPRERPDETIWEDWLSWRGSVRHCLQS